MIPKAGDIIYMQSELYLSHGEDDIRGGKVEIQKVFEDHGSTWIVFTLFPDCQYNWSELEPIQEKLKQEHGDEWARPDPDARPEFNS